MVDYLISNSMNNKLLKTHWNETIEEETHMKLEVEKELERKLSAGQILIEDMEQVIEHCEREDRGIIDPETGHRIGHLKIQHMTYWCQIASKLRPNNCGS